MNRRSPPSPPLARALAVLSTALLLAACAVTPVQVQPPPALATATPLAVAGRQGWLPGRELRFGDYATRSLTRRQRTDNQHCPQGCDRVELGLYSRRFDEALRTTTQRVGFTLVDGQGAEADVQLVQRIDEERRQWVTRWFGVPTDVGADFVRNIQLLGTVQPARAGQAGWRLAVADTGPQLQGWAENDHGQRLTLSPLAQLIGPQGPVALPVRGLALGYAFEREGRTVAAVATHGNGTVWLSPALGADERLALAGLAAVLLVRSNAP
jgi:hypothetical protein